MAKMKLDDIVPALREAYGESLRSVVLYGSAVRGELTKKKGYNILVIVDALPLSSLRRATRVARAWHDAGNPPPMTFTLQEWEMASDVFPLEYIDIRGRHEVLFGEDTFRDIEIDSGDLRMQVEREAVSGILRIRQMVMMSNQNGRDDVEILADNLSSIMVILRGVLWLHNLTPPQNYSELVRDAAEKIGFDPEPYYDVIHHVRGERSLSRDRASAILGDYIHGLEVVAEHVDALQHTRNA